MSEFAMEPTRALNMRAGDLILANGAEGIPFACLVLAVETDELAEVVFLDVAESIAGPMSKGECFAARLRFDGLDTLTKLTAVPAS